jgi:hypothetical protein
MVSQSGSIIKMTDKIRALLDELDSLSVVENLDNTQRERKLLLEDVIQSFLEHETKGTERSNFVDCFNGENYTYKKVLLTTQRNDEFFPRDCMYSNLTDYCITQGSSWNFNDTIDIGDINDIPRITLHRNLLSTTVENTLMELTTQAYYHECEDKGYTHVIIKAHHRTSTKEVEELYKELKAKYQNAEITIVQWRGYHEALMDTSITFLEHYTNLNLEEEFGEILKFAGIV